MKPFLHLLRAIGIVCIAAVAVAGLWVGYLALSPAAQASLRGGLSHPVPAWVLAIVALLLVAVVVAFVSYRLEMPAPLPTIAQSEGLARELAAGLTEQNPELIWDGNEGSSSAMLAYITELLEQLAESSVVQPRKQAVQSWVDEIAELPDVAYALLDTLSRDRHLEGDEIERLRSTVLWPSLQSLRRAGFIVPVVAAVTEETVYWLPDSAYEAIREAIDLVTAPSQESRALVAEVLASVGYPGTIELP